MQGIAAPPVLVEATPLSLRIEHTVWGECQDARGCKGIRGRLNTESVVDYGVTVAQTAKGTTAKLVEPLGLKIWTSHVVCDAGKEASTLLFVPFVSGFT
jgi:hypothetical protein